MYYNMYRTVPAWQTGDNVACGAYYCGDIEPAFHCFDGPSDCYWIVPGTYED